MKPGFWILASLLVFSFTKDEPQAKNEPPASILHQGGIQDIPSVASNLVAYPVRCGNGGHIFFRMYKDDPLNAPVVEVSADEPSVTRTFNFLGIHDPILAKPDGLKVSDFQVHGSTLYAVALDGEQNPVVLKFSTDDGSYSGAFALEKGFFAQKFAVFDSGGIVLTGLFTQPDPNTGQNRSENVTAEYDRDGRFVQYLKMIGDVTLAGPKPSPAELQTLSFTHMAASGSNVYILRPGPEPSLYVVPEGGGKIERHALWSPGPSWLVFSLLVSGDRALVSFVHDPATDGTRTQYVQYSLTSFEATSTTQSSPDVVGAFGCTDWQGTFFFVTTRNKHVAIVKAR